LRAKLPASGRYFVHLSDAQHQGGQEFAYRLRLSAPRPDFELRVAPSSVNVRGGANVPLTIYALRKDGFTNEIALSLKNENGFTISGGRVPANQDQIRVTLTAPVRTSDEPVTLTLQGYAKIEEQMVLHPVIPAEDMMQAFAYRHLVPAHEMQVAVSHRFAQKSRVRVLSDEPVKIPPGGTAKVRIAGAANPNQNFRMELSEPPEGVAIRNVSYDRDGAEIVLQSDKAKSKPGQEGNLIVAIFSGRTQEGGKNAAKKRFFPVGVLPAVPFEIVAAH
jgi:hypothetical protein